MCASFIRGARNTLHNLLTGYSLNHNDIFGFRVCQKRIINHFIPIYPMRTIIAIIFAVLLALPLAAQLPGTRLLWLI
jgi:hypothetical protein